MASLRLAVGENENAGQHYPEVSSDERQSDSFWDKVVNIFSSSDDDSDQQSYHMAEDRGGNFGDMLSGERQSGDTRSFSEIFINDEIYSRDTAMSLYYDDSFPTNITTVRALNLGRERAYVQSIGLGTINGEVKIDFMVRAGQQVRILVEIYTAG